MHSLYGIQLLDDIHTYFPELLYNPSRFQNVSQVLEYIRSIAMRQSPYVRGYTNYNLSNNTVPSPPEPIRIRVETQEVPTVGTTVLNGTFDIPIGATQVDAEDPLTILSQLLNPNSMFNTLFAGLRGDTTFENVIVRPTDTQIANATSLDTVTALVEDNCAICQDPMERGAHVRKINVCGHTFHQTCIDTWFTSNVRCPICRRDIRESGQQDSTQQPRPSAQQMQQRIARRRPVDS